MTPSTTFGIIRQRSLFVLILEAISTFLTEATEATRRNGDLPYFGL